MQLGLYCVLALGPVALPQEAEPAQAEDAAESHEPRRLRADERTLLAWHHGYDPARHEETYKPVLHLRSPDGAVRLTKGPGGRFSHHRGLFLGWSKVSSGGRDANTWWSPDGREDRQELARFLDVPDGLGAEVTWIAADGNPIARDERRFRLVEATAEHYVVDAELVVHALDAPLVLDGDPAHGGFQVRFAQEVAEREDCDYLRPARAEGQGNDNWTGCAWVAARARVEGRAFAVALIDHPANPAPTVYNTRSYGRFGPFFRTEVALEAPLHLRYRLVVVDVGALGRAPEPADFAHWAAPFRAEGAAAEQDD